MTIESMKQDIDSSYEGGFHDDETGPVFNCKAVRSEKEVRVGKGYLSIICVKKTDTFEEVSERAKRHYDYDERTFLENWSKNA